MYAIRLINLRNLVRKYGGQKGFADKAEISANQLSHIIGPNPIRNLGERLARKIEKNLHLENLYLDQQHNKDINNDLDINVIFSHEIEPKHETYQFINSKPSLCFTNEWATTNGFATTEIFEFQYQHNNMYPNIIIGDLLAIDTSNTHLQDKKTYLILINGDITIFRIFRQLNGTIIFSNDNNEKNLYPDLIATTDQIQRIRVIGSVVALFRKFI
ncbi:S24 family peptidase [Neisseriaceae bacterium ESL0693]|nr:S24 family peptidase [Neisseriaceae bacterium ESL0693]